MIITIVNLMGSSIRTSIIQWMAVGSRDSLAVAKQVPQSTIVSTVTFSSAERIRGTTQTHIDDVISHGQCLAPRIKADKISAEIIELVMKLQSKWK